MHERRHLYINGNWIEPSGEGSIEVINPTNEEVIGSVPVSSDSDANAAVEAARSAFTDWSTTEVSERVEFLNRISGLIKDRSEESSRDNYCRGRDSYRVLKDGDGRDSEGCF